MLHQLAVSIANAYWASHLGGAPAELFARRFRVVIHGAELADYAGAFALFREDTATASIPADRAEALRGMLSGLADGCTPGSFAAALAPVAVRVIGPAWIGYTMSVVPPAPAARALEAGDAAALEALREACDETEWEHGGSADWRTCSGVLAGGQLAALAGYEVWGGSIAHLSIVTHPGFRGRGFGRSAVAHLARRALDAGLLPQYRTLEENRPAMRIAEALGFQLFATSMAVRFRESP